MEIETVEVESNRTRPKRKLTREDIMLIKEGFRAYGTNVAKVAESVGYPESTVYRLYRYGYPKFEQKPLREEIKDDQAAARIATAEQLSKERLDSTRRTAALQANAVATAVEESSMVRGARGHVIAAIAASAPMLRGLMNSGAIIGKMIEEGVDESGNKIPLMDRIEIANKISVIVKRTAEASLQVLQAERLVLGQPTEILGLKNVQDVPIEDAVIEIRRGAAILDRVQRRDDIRKRLASG